MAIFTGPTRVNAIELHVLSDQGDMIRARIEGRMAHRFDAQDDEPLQAAFGWDTYSRRVMLDLSEVSAMDTSGLSWLLLVNKRLNFFGGKLVVHSLPPIVRSLIRVLNLQTILNIADDEAHAEAILAGGNE